jgi:heat shock protein HtpX
MWELIRANKRRAALMAGLMAGLLLAVGYVVGEIAAPGAGLAGLTLAFLVWVGLCLASYYNGDRILLAVSGARRIRKQDHPVLWNVVEEMCIASGLSTMPAVYIIDQAAPNAFAAGRDPRHASVAVTAGLLERLDRDELQGVIAHELAHVKNRDVLYMTMVGIMMGTIVMLADVALRMLFWGGGRRRTSSRDGGGNAQIIIMLVSLVLVVLAPFLAQLMYFALSRRREYLADACSAQFTRYPDGLARALEKISSTAVELPAANRATAPLYIVNPLKVTKNGLSDLTSTHPPTSKRVAILRALGGGALSLARYDEAFRKVTGRAVGVVPAGSLRALEEVPARRTAAPDPLSHLDRVRQTTDALWHLNRYIFLACACGTKLKVPPEYAGREIPCPHCGAKHRAIPSDPGPATASPAPPA